MSGEERRILFAAPRSGSGKTTITCGVLEAMKRRGLSVASLKCGPDYIDPMFHREVLGIPSGNLDAYFTDENTLNYLLKEQAKNMDITVLEGVMGYYDGLAGESERASTYEIARITGTPVILILDAKGASVSLAALVKGMLEYRSESRIRGVILNRVSPGYYERLKDLIERECGIPVLGYLPEAEELLLQSRHLGLKTPKELEGFQNWVRALGDAAEKNIAIDALLEIGGEAETISGNAPKVPVLSEEVCLAVARDEAFSFYYSENLALLKKMGAKLVEFSPLHDQELPKGIDGILLGGGYPENFAKELEANHLMREEVFAACQKGLPCLAECGGFLYLQKELEDADGGTHRMAGVLPGKGYRTKGLCRFGYLEAESLRAGVCGEKNRRLRGHEFHHWDCTENGEDFLIGKPSGRSYAGMLHTNTMLAGFPHYYYYSNPGMIYEFLLSCQRFRAGRLAKEHWDKIAKPIDSLGLLEEQTVRLCRIAGSAKPYDIGKRALLIFCADHGVVAEGVTQTGSEVTKIVSENFAKGVSTVNYMAGLAGLDVYPVDVGMDTEPYPQKRLVPGTVIDRKIRRGSRNLAKEAAMTTEECLTALETGKSLVKECREMGYRILATGEMGIGNTTSASALAAAFLRKLPAEVTGKGAGLSKEGLQNKIRAVQQALKRIEEAKITDPVEILAQAGGYEIAAMTGVFLGGITYGIPVVIDGAISAAAALAAMRIDPRTADYVLASHEPEEAAGRMALQALGLEAILHGRMCLGEGTGAAALFPILDMALAVYQNMGTFTEYEIEPYERFEES